MKINTNARTGIPYGYVAALALDPEIVDRLLFGAQARDLAFERFCAETQCEVEIEAAERGFVHGSPDWESFVERGFERRVSNYAGPDEYDVEGYLDGVEYGTSYLGGALNFWIFKSPCTTDKARRASPCVPNAAILDVLDGSEFGYDVPGDWRDEA